MAGTRRTELTKGFQVFEFAIFVSRQMKHRVLQRTGVSIRQDKAIAVDPFLTFGGILHDFSPQNIGHGSAPHGGTGMAGICGLDHIGTHGADGVDTFQFEGISFVFSRHDVIVIVVVVAVVDVVDVDVGGGDVDVVIGIGIDVIVVVVVASFVKSSNGSSRSDSRRYLK